jgi:hypothetical protein
MAITAFNYHGSIAKDMHTSLNGIEMAHPRIPSAGIPAIAEAISRVVNAL